MLTGHGCMSCFLRRSKPFNQFALDKALRVLRKFYFVGIFEDYNKSVHALHLLANNGKSRPHKVTVYPAYFVNFNRPLRCNTKNVHNLFYSSNVRNFEKHIMMPFLKLGKTKTGCILSWKPSIPGIHTTMSFTRRRKGYSR